MGSKKEEWDEWESWTWTSKKSDDHSASSSWQAWTWYDNDDQKQSSTWDHNQVEAEEERSSWGRSDGAEASPAQGWQRREQHDGQKGHGRGPGRGPGRGHDRKGSGRGRTWNGNRGHGSLDNLNARDRREIQQWRKDKDELEKLRFQQDDHVQNLEGIIWCMEDKEEELQKQIAAQQGILAQMSCTLKSMDEKATSLHEEKVELMKNRMATESRALLLTGQLQKQGKEMASKDAELQTLQQSLKEKQAAHDEQLKCLFADFHTYQAHPGMQELMIVLQLLQPCLFEIAFNALARPRRKRRLQLCNVTRPVDLTLVETI